MSQPTDKKQDTWETYQELIKKLTEENKRLREELERMKSLKNEYKELVTDKPTEP